jgi:hypothetical protein
MLTRSASGESFGAGAHEFEAVEGRGAEAFVPEGAVVDHGKAGELEGPDGGRKGAAGGENGEADAEALRDVGFDEIEGGGFETDIPTLVAFFEFGLKAGEEFVGSGGGDERQIAGGGFLQDFGAVGKGRGGFDEEDHGEFGEEFEAKTGGLPGVVDAEGEVDLVGAEKANGAGGAGVAQAETEAGNAADEFAEEPREMLAHDGAAGGEAKVLGGLALDAGGELWEAGEEGRDEFVDIASGRGEAERAAAKELGAHGVLELGHLEADGRLLDAVGDLTEGGGNPACAGDVVEELEMVDVEHGKGWEDASGDIETINVFVGNTD